MIRRSVAHNRQSTGLLPRRFDEAEGRRAPKDVDQNVTSAPLGDLRFRVELVILHVGKEVRRARAEQLSCWFSSLADVCGAVGKLTIGGWINVSDIQTALRS
jgi:hypothetical protein